MKLNRPLLLLFLFVGASGAVCGETRSEVQLCLDSLALSQDDGREVALECLTARADTSFRPLFTSLFNGNVYVAKLPGDGHALVIPDSATGPDGESHALYSAYPYRLIMDEDHRPVMRSPDSLTEVDVDRAMRALLQPVLTAFDLFQPDPVKRRNAALLLGETHDSGLLPPLRKAMAVERNPGVRHLMEEAIARLELFSNDSSMRIAAAEKLGDLKGGNALPDLVSLTDSATVRDPALRAAAAKARRSIEDWNSFTGVLQNLFSGLSLGSILILMALGLAVIFGLMGVINMAHGEFMMIGAYTAYVIQNVIQAHLPAAIGWFLPLSFPAAFLTAGVVGMLVEITIIKRLYGHPLETLLATWGVSLILIQGARQIFGDLTAVGTPSFLSGGWEIFPQVVLPYNRIFIIFLTALIVLGMSLLFYRTSLGMKIRAVTQNRAMSASLGVRTRHLDCLTFGLGTGIAGIAGCALTQIGNVDPGMGQNYIVDSFMVVVTGGVGKLTGTVLAGLGIGTLNKFLEPFFQAVYAKVILLGLVILFLQLRPSGLFPAKGRNEDN